MYPILFNFVIRFAVYANFTSIFSTIRINAIDDRYRSVRSKINKMRCGVLEWSLNIMKGHWGTLRRSLLSFSIRREKKRSIIYWGIGRDLLRDIRSAICIECLVKIARTLFKLDALIFAGQKRQLEIMTYKDKAFTWCTIWHVNLYTRIFIGL